MRSRALFAVGMSPLASPEKRLWRFAIHTEDRLRRKSMMFTNLNAENIARQMERADLPTTVGQEFVRPNCTLTYPVDVVRGLCFSENLRAAAIFELAPTGILIG
jgi:hypothetical protein